MKPCLLFLLLIFGATVAPRTECRASVVEAGEIRAQSARFTLCTRPIVVDTDGDGLPDVWEASHGSSPTTPDALLDPDFDGLTNIQEYNAGTNPLAPDNWTLSSASSPAFRIDTRLRHSGKIPVTDVPFAVYRVSNLFRCDTGGRPPAVTDTDGDGIPDWWAIRYTNAPTALDPASDEDGDGYTALEEYIALTDPTDSDSFLCVTLEPLPSTESPDGAAIRAAMTGQAVTWPSAVGRTYTLQAITNLMQNGNSTAIATLEGTGGILAVPVPDTTGIPLRFFRLTVTLSPPPQSP